MNTRKQVLVMTTLLLMTLLLLGVYALWYPSRATKAEQHFEELTAERGSILFARNCRLCHGDVGQGGLQGARLAAAPALNRTDLQGFVNSNATLRASASASATSIQVSNTNRFSAGQLIRIGTERMRVRAVEGNNLIVERGVQGTEPSPHASGSEILLRDKDEYEAKVTLITDSIACGRVGTAMPAWAQRHGGTLSDEQIRQLTVLITEARWDLVQHEVDIEDLVEARLLAPVSATTRFIRVSDVRVFSDREVIRIGAERMRVVARPTVQANDPDPSGVIEVDRGVLRSSAQEHPETERIYRFPEAPDPPAILQQSCGQTARGAPPPTGTPGLIEPFEGQTVQIVAQNILFDLREIRVQAGGQVRLRLDNRDPDVLHNIAVYQSQTNLTPVSPGSVGLLFPGPAVDDTVFDIPPPGSYFFRCDEHPTTMTGTFIVQ